MRRDAGGEAQGAELVVGAAVVSGHGGPDRPCEAVWRTVKCRSRAWRAVWAAASGKRRQAARRSRIMRLCGPPMKPFMTVTVEVPATTSNLGPGYDCLGIALGTGEPRDRSRRAPRTRPPGSSPMAQEAADAFFARAGVAPFAIHLRDRRRSAHVAGTRQQRDVAPGHRRGAERARGRTLTAHGRRFSRFAPVWKATPTTPRPRSSAGSRWRAATEGDAAVAVSGGSRSNYGSCC